MHLARSAVVAAATASILLALPGSLLAQYAPRPAPAAAASPAPSATAAAPAASAPPPTPAPAVQGPVDSSYSPTDPANSATTHPQPPDMRVWRLVDPTEAMWHAYDPNRPRGWVRVDTDGHGTSGYAGGSFRIADGLALAPFAHVGGTVAEPNLAATWTAGAFWVMPAIGTSLDFGSNRALSIDPQLFIAVDAKALYLEAWTQFFWATAYHPTATNAIAWRLMLLAAPCSLLGVGVEWDPTVTLNNGPVTATSSVLGGRTNLRLGDHDTLGLFIGPQLITGARGSSDAVAGRFEYVHQW